MLEGQGRDGRGRVLGKGSRSKQLQAERVGASTRMQAGTKKKGSIAMLGRVQGGGGRGVIEHLCRKMFVPATWPGQTSRRYRLSQGEHRVDEQAAEIYRLS